MRRAVKCPWRRTDHSGAAIPESRRRAAEFQRLPADERWREIATLMAFGWPMVRAAPDREARERRMADQEARWQQIQRELFARHGQ